MTDKDTEAFNALYKRVIGLRPITSGYDVAYDAAKQAAEIWYRAGEQAARANYAPKLTEAKALVIASEAMRLSSEYTAVAADTIDGSLLGSVVIAALRAAAIQFKEEQ